MTTDTKAEAFANAVRKHLDENSLNEVKLVDAFKLFGYLKQPQIRLRELGTDLFVSRETGKPDCIKRLQGKNQPTNDGGNDQKKISNEKKVYQVFMR